MDHESREKRKYTYYVREKQTKEENIKDIINKISL